MSAVRRIAACALLFVCIGGSAAAQDKPVPPAKDPEPPARQRSALPRLDLPEYVITGSDDISLAPGSKGAISFLDADRLYTRIGLNTRERWLAMPGLLRAPLSLERLHTNDRVLSLRAGYGRFRTPYADLRFGKKLERGDIAARLNAEQSSGYLPHASYGTYGLELSGGSFLPAALPPIVARSRVQGDFLFASREYALYGTPAPEEPPAPFFRRRRTVVRWGGDLISRDNPVAEYRIRFSADHAILRERISAADSIETGSLLFHENAYALSATATRAVLDHQVTAAASLSLSDNTRFSGTRAQPVFFEATARTAHRFRPDLTLDAALQLASARGSDGVSRFRVYPTATLQYAFDQEVTFFAGWESSLSPTTWRTLSEWNPYVAADVPLLPRDVPARIRLGVTYQPNLQLTGTVTADYRSAASWPRIVTEAPPSSRRFDVVYGGTTQIFEATGEVSWRVTAWDRLAGTAVLRSTWNSADARALAGYPPGELTATWSRDFTIPLTVEARLRFLAARPSDHGTLPAVLLLGGSAEYRVSDLFSIVADLDNLLDAKWEWWNGYRERPFFFSLGIIARL